MKKKQLLLFFVIVVIFNMAASFAHPVTPTLIVERHLDSSMFGVALAAMMVMNFLFSPFWGKLCNYVPTRKIILICAIGYSLGQVIFLFAINEAMIIGGRMFAGVFTGGAFTALSNYVINTSSDDRTRGSNLTMLITTQNVASAVGFFTGGMLGIISTETSIIAQVIVLFSCGFLFYLVCLDDTSFKVKPEVPLSAREVNPFSAFAAARQFMTPMLALLFLVIAISAIGQNSYEQCFNYFIKDQYNMTSAYNGLFKALIAGITLLLNTTVAIYLQKKTDINRTFLYILIACSMLICVILVFSNQILFVAIYIIYSGVNVIRLPLLQTMVAMRSSDETRNSVMGFYQSMNSLGGIFGALFAGLIYDMGPMLPFILAFVTYVVSTLIGGIYVRRYRKE